MVKVNLKVLKEQNIKDVQNLWDAEGELWRPILVDNIEELDYILFERVVDESELYLVDDPELITELCGFEVWAPPWDIKPVIPWDENSLDGAVIYVLKDAGWLDFHNWFIKVKGDAVEVYRSWDDYDYPLILKRNAILKEFDWTAVEFIGRRNDEVIIGVRS